MNSLQSGNSFRPLIIIISILIPLAVALLYFLPPMEAPDALDQLPRFNAIINGTTFFILIAAWRAILKGKIRLHRALMITALSLSILFLFSYVIYHSTHESTPYGGEGSLRSVYYFILLSHILLSVMIVPLVLVTLVRALREKFPAHRKIGRITLPVWLYVALTGVLVYLMISPYYS